MLAFALSIHKAQGQSLSEVVVDLKGVFEYGQAYVALSRCTTLRGLTVLNYTAGCIRTHPRVLAFYSDFKAKN
jgi:ATP-dependent DNA helicase PIF1